MATYRTGQRTPARMNPKDPDSIAYYVSDWSDWLDSGETIVSSDWVVEAGLTEDSASNDTTTATIWLSGGTAGTDYTVTNTVVTSAGREEPRSMKIYCGEK